MSRTRKDLVRDAVVAFVVSLIVSVGVALVLPDSSHMPQDGDRGFWTASQKANAALVLTSYPVNESPALANCVIAQVSQQHSFTEFLQYAKLAAANNFAANTMNSTQVEVLNSLMYAAMTCPENN